MKSLQTDLQIAYVTDRVQGTVMVYTLTVKYFNTQQLCTECHAALRSDCVPVLFWTQRYGNPGFFSYFDRTFQCLEEFPIALD